MPVTVEAKPKTGASEGKRPAAKPSHVPHVLPKPASPPKLPAFLGKPQAGPGEQSAAAAKAEAASAARPGIASAPAGSKPESAAKETKGPAPAMPVFLGQPQAGAVAPAGGAAKAQTAAAPPPGISPAPAPAGAAPKPEAAPAAGATPTAGPGGAPAPKPAAKGAKGAAAPAPVPHAAAKDAAAAKLPGLFGKPKAGPAPRAAGGPAEAAAPATQGAPASAAADPAFQAVVHHAKVVAAHQRTHAPTSAKVSEVHAAAVGPPNEVSSMAAARQTDKMDQQQPKKFDRASFKAALLKKIADTAPKNLEEADDFKDSGKVDAVKGDMRSQVAEGKQQSQGDMAHATAEKPDPSGIKPKEVEDLPPAPPGPAPQLAATGAAPKPQSDAAINLDEGPKQVDQQMAEAGVSEDQLKEGNEPAFSGALAQKKDAEKDAAQAPKDFRKQEQGVLAASRADAQSLATKDVAGIYAGRKAGLAAVAAHQLKSKSEEEKKRAEVSEHIEKIYNDTKAAVEKRLKRLDDDVNKAFDGGASAASKAFEDYVGREMAAYKADRYSGWTGKIKWGKDKLFGMPDKVNEFYQKGHDQYLTDMDGVIDRIATMVETGLNEAKDLIASGKKEIDTYVKGLPVALQGVGKKASADIQSKFESLEETVNDKQGELVDGLAKKYNDNLSKLNDRIEEMKAQNRGLVDGAIAAIKAVIKTIIGLKNMLLNVLSRVADAIGMIIAHPIRFLGNLVDAGKLGFNNFSGHILEHLKAGLLEWLFGAVGEAGITLPERFDLAGLLSLVLQILGLTYANIRARAVRIVGERVVQALETASEIFKILITKGPGGLWEYIKERLTDLKSMVIDKIQSFVMEKIITAGIIWIISLLNPVAAFIKACKAIYDIIMFFVEHGKQILALINAIIDSVTNIARGAIGAAANYIERSLAKGIPVAIGFLASLLGVGGISNKIKETINAIREPINKAIDWVINKAVQLIGGLIGAGKAVVKGAVGKITNWWAARKQFTAADGQTHTLAFKGEDKNAVLVIRSVETPFSDFVKDLKTGSDSKKIAAKNKAITIAAQIDTERKSADPKPDKINSLLDELGGHTSKLLGPTIPNSKPPALGPANAANFGTSMVVMPLTNEKRADGSDPTSAANPKYAALNERRDSPGGASLYIKGHLLNQKLGGQGIWANLTPLSRSGNAQHETKAESIVKRTVDLPAIVEYSVVPNYGSRGDKAALLGAISKSSDAPEAKQVKSEIVKAEDWVPNSLAIQAYILDENLKRKNTVISSTISNYIDRNAGSYYLASSPKPVPVNLWDDGADKIQTLEGIGPVLAERLVRARAVLKREGYQRFSSYKQIADLVEGIGEARLKTLEDAGHVKLY